MPKKDKKEVIKQVAPTIKVSIQNVEPENYYTPLSGHYHMIALRPDGTEKPGTDFSATPKLFERTYKHLSAKPEGTADNPRFKVKKNP